MIWNELRLKEHGMAANGALLAAKKSPSQSAESFANAHRAAGHGAAKKLKRSDQNCASGIVDLSLRPKKKLLRLH